MDVLFAASQAGGVAIATSADLICEPWAALLVGYLAGMLSSLWIIYVAPWVARKYKLVDSGFVMGAYGLPAVFGAIVSCIAFAALDLSSFPENYFSQGGSSGSMAGYQFVAMLITILTALLAGVTSGFFSSMSVF